jgi:hypothetical protein
MKTHNDLITPWTLRFERDGTDDIAVINDANGDELLRSRPFWLPEGDDTVPPTLAAIRLVFAAPRLLAACRMVIDRWEQGDLAEAARECGDAICQATTTCPPWEDESYSVLLLYPDYANDSGTETYYALVKAADPIAAVAEARRQAAAAQEGVEILPEDFAPLLVTQGHHISEALFNK